MPAARTALVSILLSVLALPSSALAGEPAVAAAAPFSIPKTNPSATVRERVGATDVEVAYNRPSVRGRPIFGELVPFDQVWRTGADAATRIRFSTAVVFGGHAVEAGSYELYTVPGREAWSIILQADGGHWGSYAYDPAADVVRVTARPDVLERSVETLTIGLGDFTATSARLSIAWERTAVSVPIEVDVVGQVVPQLQAALAAPGKKPYFDAAMFYFQHGLDLDQAAAWMRAALVANPGHIGMLHRLALILERRGDRQGALEAARLSLEGAASAGAELRTEYTRLNTALIARLGTP